MFETGGVMVKRSIVGLGILLIATLSFAQTEDNKDKTRQMEDAAWARAGCGPDSIRYNVKMDKHQHTLAAPESGKALVYVFEDDVSSFQATTRVGLDGKWAGGNVAGSYMFFSVMPGAHRLCLNWQGSPQSGAAVDFTAEAGKIYFFQAKLKSPSGYDVSLKLAPEAEGHFLIASHGLSTSSEKEANGD
jgi:uncharacterized protein DUF2846